MASKNKTGLGRGFDSLIPTDIIREEFDPTAAEDKTLTRTKHLLIQDIIPNPDQPRRTFKEEALQELAKSIEVHGLLQPIVVTRDGENYSIIAGERRWRAAKMAGLERIPALIRKLSDQAKLEVSIIENVQREDLSPLEMATAFVKLQKQFNLTMPQIADRVGKARSTVSNIVRLVNLPEPAQRALNKLRITEQHARAILALNGDPQKQQELLDLILKHGWSATKAEQFVIAYKKGAVNPTEKLVQHTQSETVGTKAIGKRLDTKVTIRNMANGGRIIIEFKNDEELDRITGMIS